MIIGHARIRLRKSIHWKERSDLGVGGGGGHREEVREERVRVRVRVGEEWL